MRYAYIAEQANHFPVRLPCRVIPVNKSVYYAWKKKGIKVISESEFALYSCIEALFEKSRQSLGSCMMVKLKCKYCITTDSGHNLPVTANVLDRQFNLDQPNQVWTSDITYIWTLQGWYHLALNLDLHSRRVLGWCIDKGKTTSLINHAVMMAVNLWHLQSELIHHSDRGRQHACHQYQALLR